MDRQVPDGTCGPHRPRPHPDLLDAVVDKLLRWGPDKPDQLKRLPPVKPIDAADLLAGD